MWECYAGARSGPSSGQHRSSAPGGLVNATAWGATGGRLRHECCTRFAISRANLALKIDFNDGAVSRQRCHRPVESVGKRPTSRSLRPFHHRMMLITQSGELSPRLATSLPVPQRDGRLIRPDDGSHRREARENARWVADQCLRAWRPRPRVLGARRSAR